MNKLINGIVAMLKANDGPILFHEQRGCDRFRPEYYSTMKESNTWIDRCRHHLYVISNEPINPGDWFLNTITKQVGRLHHILPNNCQKIESSTDEQLNLPKLPQHFIDRFVELKGTITHLAIERHTIVGGPVIVPDAYEINILMVGMLYNPIVQPRELGAHE